ncbi:hypothetical protein C8255_08850 [filamentous cyanobacterium CCP3]|nr:hypothetical protein C8255_08850 [filamentous cyanobacterium CCP3]
MGLVFASRRTAIEIEHVQMILGDDGYKRIDKKDVKPGDIVLYINDGNYTHIGIIIKVEPVILSGDFEFTVLSQWGLDGEYIHLINEVPETYGINHEFWAEKKEY